MYLLIFTYSLFFSKNTSEFYSSTDSESPSDNQQILDIARLQNEIEVKEKIFHTSINHNIITLDANIDDIKTCIDQKRPEQKVYKSSMCGLWLRLKTIEQMGPISLVTYLRTNQLHRKENQFLENDDDLIVNPRALLTNPRRSRLIHFHIYPESDEFDLNVDYYVGLLLFSYDDQSKFILNGHHCQRGDILIKKMNSFSVTDKLHREIYDLLFKSYFGRGLDDKLFGAGFIYVNKKWRFDLITYDDRNLYPYEYRIFDLYLLTHWLTQLNLPPNAQEMEVDAKTLLMELYGLVEKRLTEQENNELFNNWNEFIGNNMEDLRISIEKFYQTIDKEIEIIFKKTTVGMNAFEALFTKNI